MDTNELLNLDISFQQDAWSPLSGTTTILSTLEDIQGKKYRELIERLRDLKSTNAEAYKKEKLRLPAVIFAGHFSERKAGKHITYNHIIVIDIDNVSADQIEAVGEKLRNDGFVFASWQSPSGAGFKALVHIVPEVQGDEAFNTGSFHALALQGLVRYFKETHDIAIDSSGSDVPRLCFVSYDPNLSIKSECRPFIVVHEDVTTDRSKKSVESLAVRSDDETRGIKNRYFNPAGRNNRKHREQMDRILRYLTKKKLSITDSYECWFRVAHAIANTFTYDVGERYFLRLSGFDDCYDEENCKNFLRYAYRRSEGHINFGTVVYFAKKVGYKRMAGKVSSEGGFRLNKAKVAGCSTE